MINGSLQELERSFSPEPEFVASGMLIVLASLATISSDRVPVSSSIFSSAPYTVVTSPSIGPADRLSNVIEYNDLMHAREERLPR